MNRLIVGLICILSIGFFFGQSNACYTTDGFLIPDHVPYTYEKDDIYGTELSRYYRIQSAYMYNIIRNNNIPYTADKEYQLDMWNRIQGTIDLILQSDLSKDSEGILIFLKSRIQYRIDNLILPHKDRICGMSAIQQCLNGPDRDYCLKYISE